MLIEPQDVMERPRGTRAPRPESSLSGTPAAGLAGSDLADRFCFWRGRSGRRYVFSVYRVSDDADALPRYADAVVIAARRTADGTRTAVELGTTGSLPDLSPAMAAVARRACCADELHIHLLAGSVTNRQAVVADLSAVCQ